MRAEESDQTRRLRAGWTGRMMLVAGTVAAMVVGCGAERRITFVQDDYINTAVHCGRAPADRTGEPLEVAIVCVYPDDLDEEVDGVKVNQPLKPGGGITSEEWYKNCPRPGNPEENRGRFKLPRDQIYLLTNETDQTRFYGTRIGPALNGAKIDGASKDIVARVDYDAWYAGDKNAVIYVFGRFKDREGRVLRVPPAVFHPPARYDRDMKLKISRNVTEECRGPTQGQSIENITPRK